MKWEDDISLLYRFDRAAEALTCGTGRQSDRMLKAWQALHPVMTDDLPEPCRPDFEWVKEQTEKWPDRKRGSAEPSIEMMGWQRRQKWIFVVMQIYAYILPRHNSARRCYKSPFSSSTADFKG